MTSTHQYYIRWGLWNAPCHVGKSNLHYLWSDKIENSLLPIMVTEPCTVTHVNGQTMKVDASIDHFVEQLQSDCPCKNIIYPTNPVFSIASVTLLNAQFNAIEANIKVGDVVQLRFRPIFSKMPSGELCCNFCATDVVKHEQQQPENI